MPATPYVPASNAEPVPAYLTRGLTGEKRNAYLPDLIEATKRLTDLNARKGDLPSTISRARLLWTMALTAHAVRTLPPSADFVETGVGSGSNTITMLTMLLERDATNLAAMPAGDRDIPLRRLWSCDANSFHGAPVGEESSTTWRDDGASAAPKATARHGGDGSQADSRHTFMHNLQRFGFGDTHHRLHLVPGAYNESLPPKGLRSIAFLRLDYFPSAMAALTALYPLVVDGGLVYIDDYGSRARLSGLDPVCRGSIRADASAPPGCTQCPPSHAIQCPVPTNSVALCALQVGCAAAVEAFVARQPPPVPKIHRIVEQPTANSPVPSRPSMGERVEAAFFVKPARPMAERVATAPKASGSSVPLPHARGAAARTPSSAQQADDHAHTLHGHDHNAHTHDHGHAHSHGHTHNRSHHPAASDARAVEVDLDAQALAESRSEGS
jgi:hypothetical protein